MALLSPAAVVEWERQSLERAPCTSQHSLLAGTQTRGTSATGRLAGAAACPHIVSKLYHASWLSFTQLQAHFLLPSLPDMGNLQRCRQLPHCWAFAHAVESTQSFCSLYCSICSSICPLVHPSIQETLLSMKSVLGTALVWGYQNEHSGT